mgnify:CR=1 FL=1
MIGDVTDRGEPIIGDTTMLLLNAYHEPIEFTLPAAKEEHCWERFFDTAIESPGEPFTVEGEKGYRLEGRSVALFATRLPQEVGTAASAMQVDNLKRERRHPALAQSRQSAGAAS